MQLRWSARCWSEGWGALGPRCPPLAVPSEVFRFVLCYVTLAPQVFGLWVAVRVWGMALGWLWLLCSLETLLKPYCFREDLTAEADLRGFCTQESICFSLLYQLLWQETLSLPAQLVSLFLRKVYFCWVSICKSLPSCCAAGTRHQGFPMR